MLARCGGSTPSPYAMTTYLSPQDLVDRGLYPTVKAVYSATRRGTLPARKLGHRLVFLEEEIEGALQPVVPVTPAQPRRSTAGTPPSRAQPRKRAGRTSPTSDWREQLREAAR